MTLADTLRQAIQLHQAGDLASAERYYKQVLAVDPNQPDALHFLGLLAHQAGHSETGAELIRRAIRLQPNNADSRSNLGEVLRAQGKLDEARDALLAAIALSPGKAVAHLNLGEVWRERGDFDRAIECYQRALRFQPDLTEAHSNLGGVMQTLRRDAEAVECYRRAVQINPRYAIAWQNLGGALEAMGQIEDSVHAYQKAIEIQPDYAHAWSGIASALSQGRHDDAIAAYRHALSLRPDLATIRSGLLMLLQYHDRVSPEQLRGEHRQWNDIHAAPLVHFRPQHTNDRNPDRPLRIGYVSPDFCAHSVSFFIEPVLAAHHRERFEIVCYSTAAASDAVTTRLKSLTPHWRDVASASDAALAQIIRNDRIDILVDLATHTEGNRLLLFAQKPSPVQATWLGYAGSTGLSAIDWRITDAIVDPPGLTESLHSEKLMRLPRTQWCYRPPADAPEVGPPPVDANGHITFGSANTVAKMTPTTLDLWSRVLTAVPDARLLLKARAFQDLSTRDRIAEAFKQRGVDPARIRVEGWGNLGDYLNFFNTIDIALDTHPFAGGTTTCHSLFMGVPVVTQVGDRSVSRVAASCLHSVGLDDLVAETPEQFVEIARSLARDGARVIDLRQSLRPTLLAAPLCDAEAFVTDLESAYRAMWRQWCAG